MTPERWRQVKEIFQGALDCDPAARSGYLDEACGGDVEMRAEVESLLAALDDAGTFLTPGTAARSTAPFSRVCSQCNAWYAADAVVCPVDGEVLVDDPSTLVGTTLDGLYEVEALLGRGGFGAVYLARHALLRDRVAVKVLRRDLASNPAFVRRFLREGRAARAIRHPNVVSIHDLRATEEGLVYIVMEVAAGRTLRDEMRERGRLPADEAVGVLEQVGSALDAAHTLGVVHRDLKPENLMVADEADGPLVKVLDLGLAKFAGAAEDGPETDVTLPGQRMGSPRYMSPEQWGVAPRDGGEAVDARTDVYSLGVVAYELVTGRTPFEGDSIWDLRRAHVEAAPPRTVALAAGLPEGAVDAIERALSKDRSDRQASAGEFVAELAAALRGTRPFGKRRARGAVAAAAVLATVFTLAWVAWPLAPPPSRGAAPAETAQPAGRYVALSEAERLAFVDARARAVSVMMAGREYTIPPDVRSSIKKSVDQYAARAGTGATAPGKEDVGFVLERARAHAPSIRAAFEAAGVPPLVGLYLPFVESEYRPGILSPSGARGIFQILPSTARIYGADGADLDNPARAAQVAARLVRDRVDGFSEDPMRVALAVAAYNLGPAEIDRYMREVVALDDAEAEARFWALMGNTGFDSVENRETPRYMAGFFAAAIVGENPAAFGLTGEPLTRLGD